MLPSHYRFGWRFVIASAILLSGIGTALIRSAEDDKPAPVRPKIRLAVADTTRLELKAFWGPITESEFSFHRRWQELRDLQPVQARATYGGADFRALLPAVPVAPGELWELNDEGLLKFLRQLHAGARLKLHINNGDSRGGGFGCLRAYDERFADVMFRIHAEFALKECVLLAPEDGTVLRVLTHPGEILGPTPAAPALQFCPKGPKIIRAEVLQEWAYRVDNGQEVTIEDDTFAGATWQGRVKRVSQWFAEKRHKIFEPFMVNDVRTLECLIEVTSEGRPLRIGQRVRVKIKQTRGL